MKNFKGVKNYIHNNVYRSVCAIFIYVFLFCFISTNLIASGDFSIEFRDAEIRSAVRLLAEASGMNVVVPDKVTGKITASFDNISAKEAVGAVLKANGFGYVEENGILLVMPQETLSVLGEDLLMKSYVLDHAKADAIISQVQALLTGRGTAVADERTNMLHVKDTPSTLRTIDVLVAQLDKKGLQVLIESKILEASLAFVQSLGIQWGITKTGGNVQTAGLETVGTADSGRYLIMNSPASAARGAPPIGGLGLILGSFKGTLTDIQLSAAEQDGTINILARPSIVTMDNQPASIRSGVKFYVKTNSDISIGSSGGGGSASTGANLKEIDTGIELKVTPHVSENKFVKMVIDATQSEPDFSQQVDNIPTIIDNKATTTVLLKDGETTIIGGLFNIRDARSVNGIPGLMKVPIVGNLFKSRTKEKQKKELLVFVTPHIVENYVSKLSSFNESASSFKSVPEQVEAANQAAAQGIDYEAVQNEKKAQEAALKKQKQTQRKHR